MTLLPGDIVVHELLAPNDVRVWVLQELELSGSFGDYGGGRYVRPDKEFRPARLPVQEKPEKLELEPRQLEPLRWTRKAEVISIGTATMSLTVNRAGQRRRRRIEQELLLLELV